MLWVNIVSSCVYLKIQSNLVKLLLDLNEDWHFHQMNEVSYTGQGLLFLLAEVFCLAGLSLAALTL